MEENTFSETFGIHRSTLSERPLSDLFSLWVGLGYWREKAPVDLQLCGWKCLVGVRGQRSEWTGLGGDHRKAAETRVTSGCTQRRQSSVSERTTPPTLKQFRRTQQPLQWVIATANTMKRNTGWSRGSCEKHGSYRHTKRTRMPFFKRSQIFWAGAALRMWRGRAASGSTKNHKEKKKKKKTQWNITASFVSLKKVYWV